MKHLRKRILLIVVGLVFTMAAPMTAWADGPKPPRSPFTAPSTPTPAALRDPGNGVVDNTQPKLEIPAPVEAQSLDSALPEHFEPEPGGSDVHIFLPFVGNSHLLVSVTEVAPQELEISEVITVAAQSAIEIAEDPRHASFEYILREGDTLNDLAIDFGRDQLTMSCARSPEGVPVQKLETGDTIVVPDLVDLCHRVKKGETLDKIAIWYGITAEQLLASPQNQSVTEDSLKAGLYLLIPDARSRYRDPIVAELVRGLGDNWRYGDGQFVWPIERSKTWVTQGFKHGKHMAVDLATWSGTKILAADTGKVLKAGWSDNGYGYRVAIDHGIDYVTLYAHLSEYYVKPGDIVKKGDAIGAVGSTGNSTGPHLHFEIRDYGYLIDPLLVLPEDVEPLSRIPEDPNQE